MEQYVCTVCGFNMVDYHPNICPFCGASNKKFITAKECSNNRNIIKNKVSDWINRLNSSPPFSLEHAAYSIRSNDKIIWIDCSSTFDEEFKGVNFILFTHKHFLGAANLYQKNSSELWINKRDVNGFYVKNQVFDVENDGDFEFQGIDAYHINGHTQGFTFYVFERSIFICDYFFLNDIRMTFNPYGPSDLTREGALKMNEIIKNYDREFQNVCGFDYVEDFQKWMKRFDTLLKQM